MLKGFEFNKECKRFVDRSVYAQEHKILCDFMSSDNENIRLEYGDEREAQNAAQSLRRWSKTNHKPLVIVMRRQYVFAERKKGELNADN